MMHNPAHPGRILANYLQGRSITEVAKHIGVMRVALSRVINGNAAISADMALLISEAFKTQPVYWLRLQTQRDLWEPARTRNAPRPQVRLVTETERPSAPRRLPTAALPPLHLSPAGPPSRRPDRRRASSGIPAARSSLRPLPRAPSQRTGSATHPLHCCSR